MQDLSAGSLRGWLSRLVKAPRQRAETRVTRGEDRGGYID